MEHLNYCRQLRKQVISTKIPSVKLDRVDLTNQQDLLESMADLAVTAQKFILPENGVLLFDPELRAIQDNSYIRLPYKCIALEFVVTDNPLVSKCILMAVEQDDLISIRQIDYWKDAGWWLTFQKFKIEKDIIKSDRDRKIFGDLTSTTGPLLHFINALSCSNVHVERSDPKRPIRKIKSALPFDSYHVLTVEIGNKCKNFGFGGVGNHRSPREHLRRGHIRCLQDGRRIWVNATVVGAGKGAGVITKDYRVRAA